MSRSTVLFLIILIGVAAGLYYLSTIDTEVEVRTIEEPVSEDALQG